jgi:hypothetical protein
MVQSVLASCFDGSPAHVNSSSMNNADVISTALMTEYLPLGYDGHPYVADIRCDANPAGSLRNVYRTHAMSQFNWTGDWPYKDLYEPEVEHWNETIVTFEGVPRALLWLHTFVPNSDNYGVALLLDQQNARHITGSGRIGLDVPKCTSYVILNQWRLPYADITSDIKYFDKFERVARPCFSGWWRGIRRKPGVWRVFCENLTELVYAKLALS